MTNKFAALIFALALCLLLTACDAASTTPTPTPEAASLTPVSVQFNWVHTIEYAGFQIAEREGYYREAGLAVEMREATFDADGNLTDHIDEVASGRADFGITGSDVLLKARAEGVPVVAIATVYQRLPNILIALKESGIARPQDLVGKTVALTADVSVYWDTFVENTDLDAGSINRVERTDFGTSQLTSGEVDVLDAYLTNQPIALANEGVEINTMLLADYGVDGYPNLIFATADTVQNRPELVEAFLRATLRGYEAAVADPELAARSSVAFNDELLYDNELASMRVSVPLIAPPNTPIGSMSAEIWDLSYALLRDGGALTAEFDVTAAFDLSFLGRIYPSE
jgi:ABC-type nitrate/sulfonate/bicarbonate transport system substrate-binding protein